MTLYTQWTETMENQTEESFPDFWEKYSSTETRIYKDLLQNHNEITAGKFADLASKYDADPIIFMGFLDGINDSLNKSNDFKSFDEDSNVVLDIDFEKLFLNMLKAQADYLFTLEEWENVLSEDKRIDIAKTYKRSKTVVKEKKPGRNDPCPCGSGNKYKNCCGKRQ